MDRAAIPTDQELHSRVLALAEVLHARGQMLAAAESCTGGWIAKLLTDVPGSSAWFAGAAVTYSNDAKQVLLGIPPEAIERNGAVSRQTALAMVAGALVRFDATLAVAVTGIAGPSGGTPEKPVGTVWVAWGRRSYGGEAKEFRFAGDREAVRRRSVAAALEGLRKILTA